MIEQDYFFACPHCGEELSVRLDRTGGRQQRFVQDCEVCCRPIQIVVTFEGENVVRFSAESANE